MILEIADLAIDPSNSADFERAIVKGLNTIVSKQKGFISYSVEHSMERPERYVLLIHWETFENHMVDFRESEAFQEWRGIVGNFFVTPPTVEHMQLVAKSDNGCK